jgi:hypothetical protein
LRLRLARRKNPLWEGERFFVVWASVPGLEKSAGLFVPNDIEEPFDEFGLLLGVLRVNTTHLVWIWRVSLANGNAKGGDGVILRLTV